VFELERMVVMLKGHSLPWFVVFMAFAVGTALAAEKGDTSNLSRQDKHFIMEAAQGGMMEVQLGQYAAQHAENADVKAFGQRMVTDHSAANAKVADLARDKGVTVPTKLDKKMQKKVDKLTDKQGADFDKAYMEAMLKDHHEDIEAFEKEAKSGEDAQVKQLAKDVLPTLREHLQMAENIAPKVGVTVKNKDKDQDNGME
jgi:putative membrane protein